MVSRHGPVIAERTAYPETIAFDLTGSVRANQKADIVAGLDEATAEIAADGTCADKHELH
jgi:hypothetical protein